VTAVATNAREAIGITCQSVTEETMRSTSLLIALSAAGTLLAAACASRDDGGASGGPRLSQLPPVVSPADNPTTPEKVALGAKLWIDPRLSGSGKMACTTCHVREKGWTDGQVLSRRDNGDMNTRHSPTMYNVGYATAFYWDGRAPTLEAQVLAAWRVQISADPAIATARIAAVPAYVAEFQKVFGGPPTQDTVVKALAAYLRAKVSGLSPWDRYEMGQKSAVSADARAGFDLFMGKARCAVCHTPPAYSDFNFHNVGLEAGKPKPDLGRGGVTKKPEDNSAFKTPTLRSVAISGPYFHDGSRATLEEAVRYMASGGGKDPNKSAMLVDTRLTDQEIRQLVAFLTSLTSDEPYKAPALP
jgi:cytochrome c peroxidase